MNFEELEKDMGGKRHNVRVTPEHEDGVLMLERPEPNGTSKHTGTHVTMQACHDVVLSAYGEIDTDSLVNGEGAIEVDVHEPATEGGGILATAGDVHLSTFRLVEFVPVEVS